MQYLSTILLILEQWIAHSRKLNRLARIGVDTLWGSWLVMAAFCCVAGDSPNMGTVVITALKIGAVMASFGLIFIISAAMMVACKLR